MPNPPDDSRPTVPIDLSEITNWDEFDEIQAANQKAEEALSPPKNAIAPLSSENSFSASLEKKENRREGRVPDPIAPAILQEERTPPNPGTPEHSLALAPRTEEMSPEVIEQGKGMALIAHLSNFFLLPLFVIPMIQKDNEFALYHARQAGVAFVVQIVLIAAITAISIATCGFGTALFALLPIVSIGATVMGAIAAGEGKVKPLPMVGPYATKLFGEGKVKKLAPAPKPFSENEKTNQTR